MSDRFEQLLITLNQSELEMTSYDLADLCWLLLHYPQIVVEPSESKKLVADPSYSSNTPSSLSKSNQQEPGKNKQAKREPAGQLYPQERSQNSFVGGGSSLTFPVDNPSDIGSSLSLARALKALLRRVPTQERPSILDEVQTVESFAATDQKMLLPVFKPALEPWLELALVIDRSSSMDIWHQTLADIKTVLQHYGIFRDVQVWQLALKKNNLVLYKGLNKTNSRVSHPKELLNPNGRRIILVVSDCVASYWQDGKMFPLLKLWSQSSPLAILQMLPEWLWLKTGLGFGAKVTLISDEPGLTNSRLKIRDVLLWENVFHNKNRLQIPVFTLEPLSVEHWSGVVVGRSDTKVAGFVLTPDTKEELDSAGEQNLTPEEIVRRFRNSASLLAQELAELLAAAPTIFLPVVRLIRKEMLPKAGQVQIAEVFLGGILRVRSSEINTTDPDTVLYDFINPEVRKIFQRSSTRSTTVDVFDRVSKYIAKRLNLELREFLAELKKPLAEADQEKQGIIRPFAEVATSILRNLGGNYLAIAQELEQAAESFNQIGTKYQDAILELIQLLQSSDANNNTRKQVAERLAKIEPGNPTAITALIELIHNSPSESTRIHAVESLGQIGAGNQTAIRELIALIRNLQVNSDTRIKATLSLNQIDPGNQIAIDSLIQLLQSSNMDNDTRRQAAESLEKIDPGSQIANAALRAIREDNAKFDVFLAHNVQDKPEVRAIALALKQRNIKPWIDEEQIPSGRSFQDEIQQAIPLVKSAAIFIGSQGLGRWQSWELKAFIAECVDNKIPVIPVLLPGVNNLPEDLVFLTQLRWVTFSNGIEDKAALDSLVWGISGEYPQNTPQQKILILAAIPHGLRLDREIREIEEAIRRATRRDLFEILFRTAVRPQDIRRAIAEEHPFIVHFCGHGLEDGSLLLEDDSGNNKPVAPEGLASLFKLHADYVNCVLLNACYSAKPAHAISQHINYAIGMNQPIGDKAAIAFAQGFYDGLGYENSENQSVFQRAFDEGLVAIQLEDITQEQIPVLKYKLSYIENSISKTDIYIERPPRERKCYDAIVQPGALIRIKAPQKMGKTLLLEKVLDYARQKGYETVKLDLKLADSSTLTDLRTFLHWLCINVSDSLNIEDKTEEYWQDNLGINTSCTRYFQRYLLSNINTSLVFAIDNFERLFKYENIFSEFCLLLRSWYETAKQGDRMGKIWKKLRLVVVNSTETYPTLDTNRSPFNVGLAIELPEFNQQQIEEMVKLYDVNSLLSKNGLSQLMQLVGGHPYLLQQAIANLKEQETTLEELLTLAPTEQGIFSYHLRQQLEALENDSGLIEGYKRVITADQAVQLSPEITFKLHSLGLVKIVRNDCIASCDLYRQYFLARLG